MGRIRLEQRWKSMVHSLATGFNRRFLCTSAAAEVVYLTALEALNNQSILTTNLSVLFYSRFLPSVSVGTYPQNSWEYDTILSGLIT
jgi:hypothetical protein